VGVAGLGQLDSVTVLAEVPVVSEDPVVDDDALVDTVADPDLSPPAGPVATRPALPEQAAAPTTAASTTAANLVSGLIHYLTLVLPPWFPAGQPSPLLANRARRF
jgi:hypothetical protein